VGRPNLAQWGSLLSLALILLLMMATASLGQREEDLKTRVALVEQTVAERAERFARIEQEQAAIMERVNRLESDLSTIRGFGLGIGSLLAAFQTVQIVLQLRVKRKD